MVVLSLFDSADDPGGIAFPVAVGGVDLTDSDTHWKLSLVLCAWYFVRGDLIVHFSPRNGKRQYALYFVLGSFYLVCDLPRTKDKARSTKYKVQSTKSGLSFCGHRQLALYSLPPTVRRGRIMV